MRLQAVWHCQMRITTYISVVKRTTAPDEYQQDTAKRIVHDATKQIISTKSHGDSIEKLGWMMRRITSLMSNGLNCSVQWLD